MRILSLAATVVLSMLLRCLPAGAAAPAAPSRPPSYKIKIGDGLLVEVTGAGGIDRYVRVSTRGAIRLPGVGEVLVAGKTADEAVQAIAQAFSGLKNHAGVTIEVIKSGSSAGSAYRGYVLLFGARFTTGVKYKKGMFLENALKSDVDVEAPAPAVPARIVVTHLDSTTTVVDWRPGTPTGVVLRRGDTIWVSFPDDASAPKQEPRTEGLHRGTWTEAANAAFSLSRTSGRWQWPAVSQPAGP